MTRAEATLVYLHGASVRDTGTTEARLRHGLDAQGLVDVAVVALPWGRRAGVAFPDVGRYIPHPTLGSGSVELEAVARGEASARVAGVRQALLAEAERLEAEVPDARAVAVAVRAAAASPELRRIATRTTLHDPTLSAAVRELVRAEVAAAAPEVIEERPTIVSRLLCAIVERIAAVATADAEWCPPLAGTDVPRWVTGELRHCRPQLTAFTVAALTDVFHYLRRGGPARTFVRRAIAALPGPCLVVGESLGGILAGDALAVRPPGNVRGLVTVGSQVAVLHAMDALASLRPADARAPFTPWLNVYSEYDFASFLARPGWPGVGGIEDVEVDDEASGFPESHSRYWDVPATFERLGAFARRVLA